ncbi:hypothetical protein GP486_007571, partial [Trichoglossum hirsutum]
MSAAVAKKATVTLTPLNFPADSSPRVLNLTPSTSVVRIGRASKSASKNLYPGPDNCWFDSPVMSREHAQLSITQNPKAISLTDIGSMHGTKVDNKQLKKQEVHRISNDQIVTFGSEVARGKEIYPPRQFRVHIDWDDWSPPTPISSSPITRSPNRGYGITDEELMISSDDDTSNDRSSVDKCRLNPTRTSTSLQQQVPSPLAGASTFAVPDSEPSSPLTGGHSQRGSSGSNSQTSKVSSSQDVQQASHTRTTISCPAELVDIEFSSPVGLTKQEKIEDAGGLFLTVDLAEREFKRPTTVENTSSCPIRQAKDLAFIDLDEETGNAKNPVIIEDTQLPAHHVDSADKLNDPEPISYGHSDCAVTGREPREDEEYSPPPASAYGNDSSAESDHDDADMCLYASDSDENGSEGNLDDEMASDDEFDNDGWSRPASDHEEEDAFDYYDEPSESGDDDVCMDEEVSSPVPEPSKLSVMTEAMKTLESTTVENPTVPLPPPPPPPTIPAVPTEGGHAGATNICSSSTRAFANPNTQYRGTNCSLPSIQKMKVSESVSPIFFSLDLNPTLRAPSPSDAAMVKSSNIQTNPNVCSFLKERFGEPVPQNRVMPGEPQQQTFSNGRRSEITATFNSSSSSSSSTDNAGVSESIRANNARKLGERSGKSEFFKAREENRKEAFLTEPKKPVVPQPTSTAAKCPSASDIGYLFFEPANFDLEAQDMNAQKFSKEFRDFTSTASEAGSFGATDEICSPPVMAADVRQVELRAANCLGFANASSAATFKLGCESWADVSSRGEVEMAKPSQDTRKNP